MGEVNKLVYEGLWKNNPGIVQLLGLCPLLAVTGSVTNALGMGFATLLVLVASNVTVSLIRKLVIKEIRIPVFVMIIAAFVTLIQLLINAYAYDLYLALGIFLPLIVTNCIIMGRAEAYAARNPVHMAALDGLFMGAGFMIVLLLLGAMREILGQGTLFDGADLLLGSWASVLRIELFHTETPFLLAILPPGAFLGMGLLIAAKNWIDMQLKARQIAQENALKTARIQAQ